MHHTHTDSAMSVLDAIAERRIAEALARGEFDNLPGAGAPLDLAEDPLVREDLRVAYRMLRNAGFVPPELEAHRDLRRVEQLLLQAAGDAAPANLIARVNFLVSRAGARAPRRDLRIEQAYFRNVADRLAQRRGRG